MRIIFYSLMITVFLSFVACSPSALTYCEKSVLVMGDKIYLKKVNWGVNGNNRLFIISTTNEKIKDINDYKTNKEFVFKGDIPIYIRTESESLVVYTYNKVVPPSDFDSRVIIKQVEINNRENMMFMNDTSYINIDRLCLD